jgi:hypothetical protein
MASPFQDLVNQNNPVTTDTTPDPYGLDKYKSILQRLLQPAQENPQLQQYQQTLQQPPQAQPISWGQRFKSLGVEALNGKQAQQQYLNEPNNLAYQNWATKAGAQEKGLTVPAEVQSMQNKPLLDYLRAQDDVSKIGEQDALAAYHKKQAAGYQPDLTYEQQLRLKETGVPKVPPQEHEEDREEDNILRAQGVDPEKATPEQRLDAYKENIKMKHPETPAQDFSHAMATENQLLRERDKTSAVMDKIETPLDADNDRITRLIDIVANGSQATDPTIAPALLQVITQGKGRMSEAEISRIFAGPDNYIKFQRFLGSWKTDPNNRYQMPQEVQDQIKQVVGVLKKRNDLKLQAIDGARSELEDVTNPMKTLSVINKLRKRLQDIDNQDLKPTIKIKGLVQ